MHLYANIGMIVVAYHNTVGLIIRVQIRGLDHFIGCSIYFQRVCD